MSIDKQFLSRRRLLKAAAIAVAAGAVTTRVQPQAYAQNRALGTVIDYAAGVPSAAAVKRAGHMGAVRYVSRPRPGAESWMLGKPVTLKETRDFAEHGLSVASVYQYGKADSADWHGGAAAAATHAPQAISLHQAAGGPKGVPIYVAIDDNPTRAQYDQQIRPYLQAFRERLAAADLRLGIYGNYSTINWAIQDGIGEYYWQHNWGSNGRLHPQVHLHQERIDKDQVDGVGVDINRVYQADWGQWQPGKRTNTQPAAPAPSQPNTPSQPSNPSNSSSIPSVTINGSSISSEQIQRGLDIASQLSSRLN